MKDELLPNPLHDERGMTLTSAHLVILGLTGLALLVGQLDLPYEVARIVIQFRRVMFLLVGVAFLYHLTMTQLQSYQRHLRERQEIEAEETRNSILKQTRIDRDKIANEWDNVSAHPSRFLTTRDGKPRLFPFPLGKAGGQGLKGELWWEAGNSAHVYARPGHFKQKETPEMRQKLRWEVEDKEEERLLKAKKVWKAYDEHRKKWMKRLGNIKMISLIVVLALMSRKAAVVALGALIYYVLFTELSQIMAKQPEEKPDEAPKRKTFPDTPGMAMTYIYEPDGGGGIETTGAFPVSAPSNRLMTSTSSTYAS